MMCMRYFYDNVFHKGILVNNQASRLGYLSPANLVSREAYGWLDSLISYRDLSSWTEILTLPL